MRGEEPEGQVAARSEAIGTQAAAATASDTAQSQPHELLCVLGTDTGSGTGSSGSGSGSGGRGGARGPERARRGGQAQRPHEQHEQRQRGGGPQQAPHLSRARSLRESM